MSSSFFWLLDGLGLVLAVVSSEFKSFTDGPNDPFNNDDIISEVDREPLVWFDIVAEVVVEVILSLIAVEVVVVVEAEGRESKLN